MPFFNVSKIGKTLQTIALCQRPDSVCWLCHKPVAVTKIRVITFNQHWPRVMEKSGFFRQHLITSIRKEKRNCRNVHPDLTYGSSAWLYLKGSKTSQFIIKSYFNNSLMALGRFLYKFFAWQRNKFDHAHSDYPGGPYR